MMASFLHRATAAWETVQVELHGQYSPPRLAAMRQYIASTSLFRAALVAVLTPLPCLCVILGLDALPLVSPYEGVSKQTVGFWFRWFYVAWSCVYFATQQVSQVVPSLAISHRRLWLVSLGIGTILMGTLFLEMLIIGFPVPFTFQVQTGPVVTLVGAAWWLSWKDILRADPLVKANFVRFLWLSFATISIFAAYVGYNLVFNQLRGLSQFLFSLLLPPLKMFLKVRVSRTAYHFEDLAPVHIVSCVDLFHTLFMSVTMQQTPTSTLTLGMFMTVDVVQGAIAAFEVRQIAKRLDELQPCLINCNEPSPSTVDATIGSLKGNYLSDVVKILESNERVRLHPSVALPRHERDLLCHERITSTRHVSGGPRRSNATAIWPAEKVKSRNSIQLLECELLACTSSQVPPPPMILSDNDLVQLEYTQKCLKLLHMTEFYVLIEYVEVMTAALYAVYVFALSKLPNRLYYLQFAALSDMQMQAAVAHVAVYALLELLSLVVLFLVLRWQMKGISPMRQLAFALQTHRIQIQSDYMIALVLAVQLSLEHSGTDFTFKFKWLHEAKPNSSA